MKITKFQLKQFIKEEIESDPALLDAIYALTDVIDGLDVSVDFMSAALTGGDPLAIAGAQKAMGRAYRPVKKSSNVSVNEEDDSCVDETETENE